MTERVNERSHITCNENDLLALSALLAFVLVLMLPPREPRRPYYSTHPLKSLAWHLVHAAWAGSCGAWRSGVSGPVTLDLHGRKGRGSKSEWAACSCFQDHWLSDCWRGVSSLVWEQISPVSGGLSPLPYAVLPLTHPSCVMSTAGKTVSAIVCVHVSLWAIADCLNLNWMCSFT